MLAADAIGRDFTVTGSNGETRTVATVERDGRWVILQFTDGTRRTCRADTLVDAAAPILPTYRIEDFLDADGCFTCDCGEQVHISDRPDHHHH